MGWLFKNSRVSPQLLQRPGELGPAGGEISQTCLPVGDVQGRSAGAETCGCLRQPFGGTTPPTLGRSDCERLQYPAFLGLH